VVFSEKDANGAMIDYGHALSGALHLVLKNVALTLLSDGYRRMIEDGLLPDKVEGFDEIIERCRKIEQHENAVTD
jgi:hypothetical protein